MTKINYQALREAAERAIPAMERLLMLPVDGSLLVCAMEGEYRIKRYRKYPRQHLEDLSTGKKEALPVDDDGCTGSNAVFGVITHVINDARSGEFDDCPVI